MSQSQAKASRREIRRAIGPAAISTFEAHEEAIRSIGIALNDLRAEVVSLAKTLAILSKETRDTLRDLDDRTSIATHDARIMLRLSVWGRLRWLFTGK